MKKTLLLLLSFVAAAIAGNAQETDLSTLTDAVYVQKEGVPAGSQQTLSVCMKNSISVQTIQFDLYLPEGLSIVANEDGELMTASKARISKFNYFESSIQTDGALRLLAQATTANITVGDGEIAKVIVNVDAGMILGEYPIEVKDILLVSKENETKKVDAVTTAITITERADSRVVLDENSTTAPTSATGVNVRVKRAINANEWSTICLPFAMSEAQVKAAFGDDVQLADFTGWETTEYDASDNAQSIDVTFSSVTAIEANHPYVIKVSSAVTEFTVDGVDIAPEADPAVSVGKKSKGTLGSFTGSYVPTLIDEECLFLNSNKFWYSTGKTNMKGYRGYFYFQDVLAAYSASAPVKMKFTLDGTTGIEDVQTFNGSNIQDGEIYDLAGRRVEKAGKGIYIINNKKVLVK